MKKFVLGTLILFGLFTMSCTPTVKKEVTMTYVIHYPDRNDTIIISNIGGYQYGVKDGVFYIEDEQTCRNIQTTTAPVEVISYIKGNDSIDVNSSAYENVD